MNKNSNTLFGSKQNNTVVKNIVEAEPMMFGVPTESNKVGVKFAVHKDGNTIATGAEGQLVFNVLENNTGVIYLGTEVVSSKILNVTSAQKDGAKNGIKTITVSYVDNANAVQTHTFEVVDAAAVESYIADFKTNVFDPYKTATDASIARIDTSVNNLEDWAKTAGNLTEAGNGAITVTPAAGTNGFQTWTVGTNVDGKTIVVNGEDKLATDVKIKYVAAAEGVPAHIALTDNADKELSTIAVSDLVGNGQLKSTAYHKETGILDMVFAQADGTEKKIEVNLGELLDVNDVLVKNDSSIYLDIDLTGGENSQFVLSTKMVSLLNEEGKPLEGIVANGLLDASVAKSYIDQKATDLAISASGDTYVNAAVDAGNNKKINVSANVNELTVNKVGEGDTTISGVSTTLVSGGEVATKVSTFVNNRIDEEIKKLDVPEAIVEATNASFKYAETDGIVSISDFALDYSSVAKTATTSTADAPKTDASITVTNGSKLAVGSDIEKVAQYAADKVTEEMHRVDAKIAALRGDVTSDDAAVANVQVKTEGGQVSDVIVTTISAGVNRDGDAQGARKLAATTSTGAVTGADVATIKGYVDDKITDVTGAQDSAVTVLDASSFITTTITMVDGALNQDQSSLSYKKAVYANDSNTVTENGLVDGQLALDMINDRIADLDKEAITSKDTNEYVSITLKVEDGISSITSVAVKTKDVSTATADSEGLATAYGAKSYVDARLTWSVI